MNQCMNKRIDDWMDGWMDGWLSYFFAELLLHWVTSSLRYLFSPHFFSEQPLLLPLSELLWTCRFFFGFFLVKSSSRDSHILPTSCGCQFFFCDFEVQIELWLQSCALFVDNFCRSRRETGNLLGWPREPHHPRKHRVSHPRVFSPMNSHGETELLHFPTILDDDDVVDIIMGLSNDYAIDMMLGLRWWCGWHDDDAVDMMMWMLTMTIVLNSKVV